MLHLNSRVMATPPFVTSFTPVCPTMSKMSKPQQLEDLRSLAQSIDTCYWERKEEIARQSKTSPRNSSNNGNNNVSTKSDKKTPFLGNSPQPANSPSSLKGKNASKPDIAEKLGKDSKLTPDERK